MELLFACLSSLCTLALTYSWAAAQQLSKTPEAGKPNIVLFIADDLGYNDIGPYGSKDVRTPHLDRLALESQLYTSVFAASPTCAPSRSSIFTGLMPFRHGAHGNHSGVKEVARSLVDYMQPLGYTVAIAGKLHVGPEDVFSFERVSHTNVPEPGFKNKPGLHYDLNMDPVDKWLSAKKDNGPFLLVVADHSPHVIWPEISSYKPADVNIPHSHIDTKETRQSRARYYEDITKMDHNLGRLLHSLERHSLFRNTVMIFTADQGPQWPFGKWSLYEDGIRVPLLIRWPGTVRPGSQTSAMVSQVDLLPTFVEMAGGIPPDELDGKSFNSVIMGKGNAHRDVVFATHTGDGMMNRSPARMLRTARYKYILNLAPENVYHTHIDKAKDHDGGREYWDSWTQKAKTDTRAAATLQRYHHRPAEELYDLQTDPYELNNLVGDERYSETIARYRKQLAAWRESQGDFETGPEDLTKNPAAKERKPVAPYVFLE